MEAITFNPDSDAATLWPEVRDRDIGHRVTMAATPPGGAGALSIELFIERITVTGNLKGVTVEFQLYPAGATAFWIMDDPLASLMGETTVLAGF